MTATTAHLDELYRLHLTRLLWSMTEHDLSVPLSIGWQSELTSSEPMLRVQVDSADFKSWFELMSNETLRTDRHKQHCHAHVWGRFDDRHPLHLLAVLDRFEQIDELL